MNILGIETSCDETAAAVVADGYAVRSSIVSSQIAQHAGFGGVVPELAAREHLKAMPVVVKQALEKAGCTLAEIDAIAVTTSPGLVPALLVGVSYAKGLAAASGKPFAGINHFLGHIYGTFLEHPGRLENAATYPLLALVVSGGHTALVLVRQEGTAEIVGTTIDDAAGEAFDKAAKILGLGYPGGPVIDRIAKTGNPAAYDFPRPLTGATGKAVKADQRFNFSFSGVKTALLYAARNRTFDDKELADLIASYQAAIVDVLVKKTLDAARHHQAKTVIACGGVACNSGLRVSLQSGCDQKQLTLLIAPPKFCTDNAAMIAGLAWHTLRLGGSGDLGQSVNARLGADLGIVPWKIG
jgi:N6-L-threonylcarbamoyladenine synthase